MRGRTTGGRDGRRRENGAEPVPSRGDLELVEDLIAREVERLGGIIEGAQSGPANQQWRREFEDLLRGCEYTFRGGQLVIFAPNPAVAARVQLDGEEIAAAWERQNEGRCKPSIVVRMAPSRPE